MNRLETLKELVRQNPSDTFARYGLAMEYARAGQFAESAAEYEAIVDAHPEYAAAYYQGGQALERLGRRGDISEIISSETMLPAPGQGEVVVRHSLVEGLSPEEMMAGVAASRLGLAKLAFQGERILIKQSEADAWGVLARARRARRPGVVFARAAAAGEVDPLEEPLSRILV